VSTDAGKPAKPEMLVNVPKLVTAYFTEVPDQSVPEQQVLFVHQDIVAHPLKILLTKIIFWQLHRQFVCTACNRR